MRAHAPLSALAVSILLLALAGSANAQELSIVQDGLARLAGRYALQHGVGIGVTPTAQGLRAVIPGMPRVDLRPRSPTSFFIPDMDVGVDFEPNAMILFVNGDRIDTVRVP